MLLSRCNLSKFCWTDLRGFGELEGFFFPSHTLSLPPCCTWDCATTSWKKFYKISIFHRFRCLHGRTKPPRDGKPGRGQSSVSGASLSLLWMGVMSSGPGQNPAKLLHQPHSSNRNTLIGITLLINTENPNRHP